MVDYLKEHKGAAILLVCGLLFWVFLYFLTGSACILRATIGFPCPGCGSTRAVVMLLRGEFLQAHIMHPLITVSLVSIAYYSIRHIFFRKIAITTTEKRIVLALTMLYTIVFIVRLIFLFPHTQPMVMNEDAIYRQIINRVVHLF